VAVVTHKFHEEWTKLLEELSSNLEMVNKKFEPYLPIIRICEDTLI
jgi:hypothetical protein